MEGVISHSTTVPVFMWSNTNVFNKVNIQEIEVLSASDIARGLQRKESKISKYMNKESQLPELVVIFIEPKLSSEELPLLAHSYNVRPEEKNGGAFSNLKRLVESSQSSLVIPYSTGVGSDISSALLSSSSKLYTVGEGKSMSVQDLVDKLNNKNWEALNNGAMDLVVIYFDSPSLQNGKEDSVHDSYAADDSSIGTVISAITKSSSNYLAIFTANNKNENMEIGSSNVNSQRSIRGLRAFEDTFAQNGDVLYTTNWPDGVIEGLVVMIPFLSILLIGVCCTLQLQSDLKFDAEKNILRKQIQRNY